MKIDRSIKTFLLVLTVEFLLLGSLRADTSPLYWPVSPQEASRHLIKRVDPEYPSLATGNKIEVVVILKIYLSKEGTVTHAQDYTAPPTSSIFHGLALEAVKQWQFAPFIVNGEAVEAVTVVAVPFLLQKRELTEKENARLDSAYSAALGDAERVFMYRGPAEAVAFSPDGHSLALVNREKGLAVWDLQTNLLRFKQPGTAQVSSLAFHANSRWLAFLDHDNKTVKIWDVVSGTEVRSLRSNSAEIYAVTFSSGGQQVATISRDGTFTLWNLATGRQQRTVQLGPVQRAVFSSDGKLLVTKNPVDPTRFRSLDEQIKLWNVSDGRLLSTIAGNTSGPFALSPDGGRVADGGGYWDSSSAKYMPEIRIYETASGRVLQRILPQEENFDAGSMAFSPNGAWLGVGQEGVSSPGDVSLWDVKTGERILHFAADGALDKFVAFSSDGEWLAYTHSVYIGQSSKEEKIKLCQVGQHRKAGATTELDLRNGEPNRILSLAIAPDGHKAAWVTMDHVMRLWDPASNRILFNISEDKTAAIEPAFSPDGRWLAALYWHLADEGSLQVKLWDSQTAEPARVFEASKPIASFAFSPDSRRLALNSLCEATFFEIGTGRNLGTLTTTLQPIKRETGGCPEDAETLLSQISFSPDGRVLVLRPHSLQLWDPATSQRLAFITTPDDLYRGFRRSAFSSDGRWLAVIQGKWDEEFLVIYDAATLREVRRSTQPEVFLVLAAGHEGQILTLNRYKALEVWDPATMKMQQSFQIDLGQPSAFLKFSGDARWMAGAQYGSPEVDRYDGPNSVGLWNLSTGQRVATMDGLPVHWLNLEAKPQPEANNTK